MAYDPQANRRRPKPTDKDPATVDALLGDEPTEPSVAPTVEDPPPGPGVTPTPADPVPDSWVLSTGMVLCGSLRGDAEGEEGGAKEVVELLTPPEGAAIGERLTVEEATAEEAAAAPDQVLKSDGQQKVWKRVAKLLAAVRSSLRTLDCLECLLACLLA